MVLLCRVVAVWWPRRGETPFRSSSALWLYTRLSSSPPPVFLSLQRSGWSRERRVTVCSAHCSFLTLDSGGSCDFSSNRCATCFLAKNPSAGRGLEIIHSNHFFCRLRNTGGRKLESLALGHRRLRSRSRTDRQPAPWRWGLFGSPSAQNNVGAQSTFVGIKGKL